MKQLIAETTASIVLTIWFLVFLYPAASYAFFDKKIRSPKIVATLTGTSIFSFFLYGLMGYLLPMNLGKVALGSIIVNCMGKGIDGIAGTLNGEHVPMYDEPLGQCMTNVSVVLLGFIAGRQCNLWQYPDKHNHLK